MRALHAACNTLTGTIGGIFRTGARRADTTGPGDQRLRGVVIVGKDGFGFTPCGSDRQ